MNRANRILLEGVSIAFDGRVALEEVGPMRQSTKVCNELEAKDGQVRHFVRNLRNRED